jgi:PAS domain-containing protein
MNVPLALSVLGPTCFAPAERASSQKLEEQYTSILLDDLVDALMQAVPGYAMLINQQRQIVAVNSKVLGITGVHESHALVGKRPGEALNCVHSGDTILTVRSHSGATAKKERFFRFLWRSNGSPFFAGLVNVTFDSG